MNEAYHYPYYHRDMCLIFIIVNLYERGVETQRFRGPNRSISKDESQADIIRVEKV